MSTPIRPKKRYFERPELPYAYVNELSQLGFDGATVHLELASTSPHPHSTGPSDMTLLVAPVARLVMPLKLARALAERLQALGREDTVQMQ